MIHRTSENGDRYPSETRGEISTHREFPVGNAGLSSFSGLYYDRRSTETEVNEGNEPSRQPDGLQIVGDELRNVGSYDVSGPIFDSVVQCHFEPGYPINQSVVVANDTIYAAADGSIKWPNQQQLSDPNSHAVTTGGGSFPNYAEAIEEQKRAHRQACNIYQRRRIDGLKNVLSGIEMREVMR